MSNEPEVQIGGPTKQTVAEVRDTILQILQSGVEQKTMRTALKVLETAARGPQSVVVTGSSFTTGRGRATGLDDV